MQETVLTPLKMTASTYQQPLPANRVALSATGYYSAAQEVQGRGRSEYDWPEGF
jgi:hypothetical protein